MSVAVSDELADQHYRYEYRSYPFDNESYQGE